METGIVKSYSEEKCFGFISNENGNSYFFHISDVNKECINKIAIGCSVSFNAIPKPKGMAAVDIKSDNSLLPIYECTGDLSVIVSKSARCGKNNAVLYVAPTIYVENRDPNTAVNILKNKAMQLGCNAILNLNRSRRTGSAWTSRYKYTIHTFSAVPALVKRVSYTRDLDISELNEQQIQSQILRIQQSSVQNYTVTDASGFRVIWFGLVILILFALSRG